MQIFSSLSDVFSALGIGILFGFFLQKAGVANFRTIKDQLLLKDFTVMKVILTAIATGSFGLFLVREYIGSIEFIISTTTLPAAFFGGCLFGVGMALLGFCPGTCVAALADMSQTAIWGFFGMIIGAFVYSHNAPFIVEKFKPIDAIDKSQITDILPISPWFFIFFLLLVVGLLWSIDIRLTKKTGAQLNDIFLR